MSRWFFQTQEEIRAWHQRRREAAQERALWKQLDRESAYYAEKIPIWLAQMGIDHRLAARLQPSLAEEILLGTTGRQMVKVLEVRPEPSAIYVRLDEQSLPYLAKLKHIYDPDVMETLSAQCERQVIYRNIPGHGVWLIIVRDGALNAIPKLFEFKEAFDKIPKNAPPLYFIAGVGENNRIKHSDLTEMPHYLVAGSTLMGKSNHLNQLLCSVIARNTPQQVQFIMLDLKGTEFNYYEGLPHLYRPIVTKPEDVIDALREYRQAIVDRTAKFAARGCKTIEGWNKQFPKEPMPYLVLVFDELSLIFLNEDRKMAGLAESLLSGGLAVSRSAGVHCILCTQLPSSQVIPSHLKVNLSERICFRVPSNTNSMVVIDVGLASDLPHHKGRAIYSRGPDLDEIQSPYISDAQITKIVQAAIQRGGAVVPDHPDEVTLQDILEESVSNYGGKLHIATMFKAFRGRIARDRLNEMIAGINGDPMLIGGRQYKVQYKGHGMHGGRVLIPLDDGPGDSAAWPDLPGIKPVRRFFSLHSPHTILKPAPESAAQAEVRHG